MDKYGVHEKDDEEEKVATEGDGKPCPKCGGKVKRHGKVQICEEHGSEPFEEK